MMNKFILILYLLCFSTNIFAENDIDQWTDSQKTYKDLIEEGFEVKAYDTNTIEAEGGITILLFITVLQKEKEIYECQEYQTLDSSMKTLDMSLVCRELSQPYQRGIGT
tara:strand:- start:220 stop:546 length:327 start_codon:yes stop_codon:yes gene_type:complete